jgi:inosine-uridine nucleoside N-ribohydrolase/catechol 2,3-dioxygenase-like lactoylglutathione lyase family enzyme
MGQIIVQKRVWVDTDIAIGQKSGCFSFCDVDDGYALAVLLRSVEVSVVGVSSTLGNTDDIEVTTNTARSFISTYGPNSVAVYQGADHKLPEDLSTMTSNAAVEQLATVLREERLTILAIGAATNIAILLLKYPELKDRIDEIVLVAGRRGMDQHFFSGHWQVKPFRDLNFESDVRAFEVLLAADVQLTLVPFEACHQVWIRPRDLATLGEANKIGRFLAERSLGWMAEWETVFGADGFNPFDMVAAGYVVQPQFFKWHQWNATIQEGPDDTDPEKTKSYLICSPDITTGRQVNYCVYVDDICRKLMLERICIHDMSAFVLGVSHVNVVVPCVDEATEFYRRVLGFQQAYDSDGNKMDYTGVEMKPFALDAGILDAKVNVDVRFLKHPQANIYLELMAYHVPRGNPVIPPQPKTFDMGGPRHIALEVSNCNEVFDYLRRQEGVTMINRSKDYHPVKLDGFPITFFYWVDKYGIQWEMEEGRQMGTSRGIV